MPRTNVTTTRISPGDLVTDVAENAVAIDAANGMRVLVTKGEQVVLRITNTHAAPHAVTSPGIQGVGNSKATHGAPGPAGSYPTEPDFVGAAIPATTGVRYLRLPIRYYRPDGSFWLNFEAAHTGTIAAVEWS